MMNTLERTKINDTMLQDDLTDVEDVPRTSGHSQDRLLDLRHCSISEAFGSDVVSLISRNAYPCGGLLDFSLLEGLAESGNLSIGGGVTELMHCETDPFLLADQGSHTGRSTRDLNVDVRSRLDLTHGAADGEMELVTHSSSKHHTSARFMSYAIDATYSDANHLASVEHSAAACTSAPHYPPSLRCVPCDKTFTVRKSLWRHQRSIHKQAVGRVSADLANDCPRCHQSFARKDLLRRHIRYQHNSAKMACRICGSLVAPRSLPEHEGGQQCLKLYFRERCRTGVAVSNGEVGRFEPVPGPSSFWKTMDPLSLAAVLIFDREEFGLTPFIGGPRRGEHVAWKSNPRVPRSDAFAVQSLATTAVRSSLQRDHGGDLSLLKWTWLLVALSRVSPLKDEAQLHSRALKAVSRNLQDGGHDPVLKCRFKVPVFMTWHELFANAHTSWDACIAFAISPDVGINDATLLRLPERSLRYLKYPRLQVGEYMSTISASFTRDAAGAIEDDDSVERRLYQGLGI